MDAGAWCRLLSKLPQPPFMNNLIAVKIIIVSGSLLLYNMVELILPVKRVKSNYILIL